MTNEEAISNSSTEQIATGFNFVDAAGAGYSFEKASNLRLKQLTEYAFGVYQDGNHSTGIVERTSNEFLGLAIAAGTELMSRGPGADLTQDEIDAFGTKIVAWRRDLP
jgi:hypothetical protein